MTEIEQAIYSWLRRTQCFWIEDDECETCARLARDLTHMVEEAA